jgi:hypothetical protein
MTRLMEERMKDKESNKDREEEIERLKIQLRSTIEERNVIVNIIDKCGEKGNSDNMLGQLLKRTLNIESAMKKEEVDPNKSIDSSDESSLNASPTAKKKRGGKNWTKTKKFKFGRRKKE